MIEKYTLRTRTPLWTGDIVGRSGVLRETSIIGSLRWWYEAIVRGLGGYACDPSQGTKCEWDANLKQKSVCPACYLFGTTGWARLFSLRMSSMETVPLFFRHLSKANDRWMDLMFKGELSRQQALWGKSYVEIEDRRIDVAYALQQAKLVMFFVVHCAGIGARTQHGFGQVFFTPKIEDLDFLFSAGVRELKQYIDDDKFKAGTNLQNAPDLSRFVYLKAKVPSNNQIIQYYTRVTPHPKPEKYDIDRLQYLPCAFELRYQAPEFFERKDGSRGDLRKFKANFSLIGFRHWIKTHSFGNWSGRELTDLLGRVPRSNERSIPDEERQGSQVSFAMPYRIKTDEYVFKVFGFSPLGKTGQLKADLTSYMNALLGISSNCWSGDAWLRKYLGGVK